MQSAAPETEAKALSAQIIELFPGDHAGADAETRRRRLWVELGVPMIVARGATLELIAVREAERETLTVAIQTRARAEQGPLVFELRPDTYVDMSTWASLLLLPRAYEYTATGRINRVLCEFVLVDRDRRFVN